jgi:hypothetical protein
MPPSERFCPLCVYFSVRVRASWWESEPPEPLGWVRCDFDIDTLSSVFETARHGTGGNEPVLAFSGNEADPWSSGTRVRVADASDNHHDLLLAHYWKLLIHMTPGPVLVPHFSQAKWQWLCSGARLPVKLLRRAVATAAGARTTEIVTWPQALQIGPLLFVAPKPRRLLERVAAQRLDVNAALEMALRHGSKNEEVPDVRGQPPAA